MPSDTTEFKKKRTKSGGRVKGTPNKTTVMVKTAILKAFDKLGGVEYLIEVGKAEPKAFLTLLAKILPAEIKADVKVDPDDNLVAYLEAAAKRVQACPSAEAAGHPRRGRAGGLKK